MKKQYFILLEDVSKTWNINMHSFECLASSFEEAIGKMVIIRRELNIKNIIYVKCLDDKIMLEKTSDGFRKISEKDYDKRYFVPIK